MRGVLCLLAISSIFLLTGCWDAAELNEIILIQGVGIDRTDDGQIEVTVEMAIPQTSASQGQGAGGGGGSHVAGPRSAKGSTFSKALEQLQTEIPRRIFWGHLQVIIINEKLAKEGITDQLGYFVRHPRVSVHSYVFIAKESAKELLSLQTELYSPSEILWGLANTKVLMRTTLVNIQQMLRAGDPVIPMVEKLPPTQGQKPTQTIPYMNHTAIFKSDKMIDSISDYLTRGLLWGRNEIRQASITFKLKNEKKDITLTIFDANTKLVPEIDGDKWKMTIKGRTKAFIVLYEGKKILKYKKNIDQLETELAKTIEERMKQTIQYAQKEKNVDIFEFAEAFERKYPKEWKRSKERWKEIYPNIEVTADIQANIVGSGVGGVSH